MPYRTNIGTMTRDEIEELVISKLRESSIIEEDRISLKMRLVGKLMDRVWSWGFGLFLIFICFMVAVYIIMNASKTTNVNKIGCYIEYQRTLQAKKFVVCSHYDPWYLSDMVLDRFDTKEEADKFIEVLGC